jgi:hypothetical protein
MSQSKTRALAASLAVRTRALGANTTIPPTPCAADPPPEAGHVSDESLQQQGEEGYDALGDLEVGLPGENGEIAHIVNVADALREHWKDQISAETGRTGLHVTTAVSPAGWLCDRVIHYAINGYTPGPVASNSFVAAELQSRFNVGHGFHDAIYRAIGAGAIHRYVERAFGDTGLRLLDVRIERPLPSSPEGVRGTPDIVLDLGYVVSDDFIEGRFSVVVDVKTVSPKAMQRYRSTKGGINVPADYRRQVNYYMEAPGIVPVEHGGGSALYGAILWVVLESPGFPSMFSFVPPDRGVYEAISRRVRSVWALNNRGKAPERAVGGHCAKCRFVEECNPYEWAKANQIRRDAEEAEHLLASRTNGE